MTAAAPDDQIFNSRAEQRRRRLLAIEREQHVEDQEALKMTEEQFKLLKGAFSSVKFEFHDLDGLRWTASALGSQQHRLRTSYRPLPKRHPSPGRMTAPKRDVSEDETIRITSRKLPPSSLHLSYNDESDLETTVPSPKHDSTFNAKHLSRDGTRQRPPVKGLFQVAAEDVDIKPPTWHSPNLPQDQPTESQRQPLCPPSPSCFSDNVFEDSPIVLLPQYRGFSEY
ncbi:hypothetical protein BKA70DRAFT_1569860 [Coprinopsis sp. MPI-PUGE-AT-0042]|nr:hypothetical protein BKA70DRAFT_1569860 [Coprinopsis sp. MPI-PUGE-AT-0042]